MTMEPKSTEALLSDDSAEIEMVEIQPATRWFRLSVSIFLPALLAAAVLALLRLHARMDELDYLALTDPSVAADGILVWSFRFFAGLAVLLGLVGAWYTAVAWKTLRSERYPPEGVPVARDTEVRRGSAARARGMLGLFLAVLLLLTALLLPTFGPRFLYDTLRPALEAGE